MRKQHQEAGSVPLMAAVVMASGLTLLVLDENMLKTNMRAKEIAQQMAVTNAQQSNVSAISYLHAALEAGPTSSALFEVENNKVIGTGNKRIQVENGRAIYKRFVFSPSDTTQIGNFFSGSAPTLTAANSIRTQLDILETVKTGHTSTYVVKATTAAKQGDSQVLPVTSVGRIRVSEVPGDAAIGQEVILDCVTCVARAKVLTLTLGYIGDITKTRNFGFYKISAAQNLCDVHFLRNLNDPIEDHDGKTSVLNTQVAVYCPCACGWAR